MTRRDASEVFEQFRAVMRSLRAATVETYSTFDMTGAQAKCLRHLRRDTAVSQAELARVTESDPALIGRVIEQLEERGWVRRKRSEVDRRQYGVELTTAGERAKKRVDDARDRIAARLASVLDQRDLADFERIAHKILTGFETAALRAARR